jgi:exonuclease III
MRIDYFIVSEKLKDRIIQCEMHGHGIELEGDISSHLFLMLCKYWRLIN